MDDKTMKIHRRRMLGASAAVLAAGHVPMARAQAGSTLRAGITGYNVINTLDPGKMSLIPEAYIVWALFNGLMKLDANSNPVPDLAESFSVVDNNTIEFKLRRGVKFHDGSDMTSDDVKFTLERVLDEKTNSPNRSKVSALTRIDVPDAHTVRLVTKEPFAPLLTFLSNARTGTQIVPRKGVTAAGDEFGKRPVGTGAYMLRDWRPGERVTVSAFPGYFGGSPRIETVDMPLIAEESSGVTALLGNQIDMTSTAPFADIPNLERNAAVTVMKQPGLNCRVISLNNRRAPFDDPVFRRACSMAFDRNAMVRAVLFGEGVVAHGLIPPSIGYAFGGTQRPLCTFDPARAKAELAKSKYPNGAEAEILTWGQSWWKRMAEVFVAQCNQTLGTKFTVQVTEANTVFQRHRSGEYQGSVWGWLGLLDADEYLFEMLHSTGWRNFYGYANPRFDDLVTRARSELDQAKRGALYKEAENVMTEEMPILPLFVSNVHNLMNKRVQGFRQLPYSNFGDQFGHMTLG
jgi:peptide/nickel transport system substrate-binding protein